MVSGRSQARVLFAPLVRLGLLIAAGVLSTGTSKTRGQPYRICHIHQAVPVPAPAPLQRPPRTSGGTVEGGVESLTSTWARAKGSLRGQGHDLYGSREQLGGYLVFSFQRWLSLGASFEVATPGGEVTVLRGPLGPPPGASGGGGLQVALHFRPSRRCRVDWTSDFWLYGQRYRLRYENAEMVDTWYDSEQVCRPPDASQARFQDDTRTMFMMRSQVSLGVDLGRVRLVVAAGLRNVPHHLTGEGSSWSARYLHSREVHTIYPYLWLGAALPLSSGLSATVGLLQPLWANPVGYAPALGIGIHFVTGDPPQGRH